MGFKFEIHNFKMDTKKISTAIFQDLHKTAKESSDQAEASSPLLNRASKRVHDAFVETLGKATNAAETVAQKAKLKFRVFDSDDQLKVDKDDLNIPTAVNWLAEVFKDVIEKVNGHGDILSFLLSQLSKVVETVDIVKEQNEKHEELVTKCNDLEKKSDETPTKADFDDLKKKHDDLDKKAREVEEKLSKKCEALDKKYDEVRQRCLKGNLIISSPARKTAGGYDVPSLANHQMFWDCYGNYRRETDLEMVLRLVHRKTGVRIQECEVTACHPLGRREKNTFILAVHNRTPMSSWEIITKGMMTAENNFRPDNIFINFQLTKRRGEICKEVRRAKKMNLIRNYEIDANGRIFVRALVTEQTKEITDLDDIKLFFPGENVN